MVAERSHLIEVLQEDRRPANIEVGALTPYMNMCLGNALQVKRTLQSGRLYAFFPILDLELPMGTKSCPCSIEGLLSRKCSAYLHWKELGWEPACGGARCIGLTQV